MANRENSTEHNQQTMTNKNTALDKNDAWNNRQNNSKVLFCGFEIDKPKNPIQKNQNTYDAQPGHKAMLGIKIKFNDTKIKLLYSCICS